MEAGALGPQCGWGAGLLRLSRGFLKDSEGSLIFSNDWLVKSEFLLSFCVNMWKYPLSHGRGHCPRGRTAVVLGRVSRTEQKLSSHVPLSVLPPSRQSPADLSRGPAPDLVRSRAQAGWGVSSRAAHEKGGGSREHAAGSAPLRPGALQTPGTALDNRCDLCSDACPASGCSPIAKTDKITFPRVLRYSYSGHCKDRAEGASLWGVQASRDGRRRQEDGGEHLQCGVGAPCPRKQRGVPGAQRAVGLGLGWWAGWLPFAPDVLSGEQAASCPWGRTVRWNGGCGGLRGVEE